jgi:hypothetical protein
LHCNNCALKLNNNRYRFTKPSPTALLRKGLKILHALRQTWIIDTAPNVEKYKLLLAKIRALSAREQHALYRVFECLVRWDNWMDKEEQAIAREEVEISIVMWAIRA